MTDRVILSHAAYVELQRDLPSHRLGGLGNPWPRQFMGMQIESSPLYPMQNACARCQGTGEGGEESTYCRACHGAGEIRTVGMMLHDRGSMTLLTSRLPRKFDPRATFTVAPRKLCRGLV